MSELARDIFNLVIVFVSALSLGSALTGLVLYRYMAILRVRLDVAEQTIAGMGEALNHMGIQTIVRANDDETPSHKPH